MTNEELIKRLTDTENKLAKAVETLKFYADVENYEDQLVAEECGCCYYLHDAKAPDEEGKKARLILAELESE